MAPGRLERLEQLLRARLGNFVPAGNRYLLDKGWSRKVGSFIIKPLPCDNQTIRKEVREYVRRTFFKEAVVPSSLELWKSDESADALFEKEMDLYLDSGISYVIRCEKTEKLMGCYLNCYWPRDPNYNVIRGFDMNEWHRVSAKIAMDVCPERPEPLWRDLQYQHLYNECQIILGENKKDFGVYLGPANIEPEARGLHIPEKVVIDLGKLSQLYNGIWMTLPTVEALRFRKANTKYGKEVGYISYEEQVLATSDGRMVFGGLAEKGGISLIVSDLTKFPLLLQYVIAAFQALMKISIGHPLIKYIAFFVFRVSKGK